MDKILPVGALTVVFSLLPLFSFSKEAKDVKWIGDFLVAMERGWFGYSVYLLIFALAIYYLWTEYVAGKNKDHYRYYRELENAAAYSSIMERFLSGHLGMPKYNGNAYQEKSFSYRLFANADNWTVSPTLQRANSEKTGYLPSKELGNIDLSKTSGGWFIKWRVIFGCSLHYPWFTFFWLSLILFGISNVAFLLSKAVKLLGF